MQPLSLILPCDTRWNGLYYHWTRLCVHLAPCLSVYYENEFKQVNVLRKTHKGQQRMKKKLNNEKMTEDQLCAGHQIQGNAGKTPRGVGFFSTYFVEASLNKNPTLDFILFIVCNFKANPLKFSFGGGVFYRSDIEATLNKNPTPWGFSRHSPV